MDADVVYGNFGRHCSYHKKQHTLGSGCVQYSANNITAFCVELVQF